MSNVRPTILNVLGKGWALPVRPNPLTRQIDYLAGSDKVRQSLVTILETEPGERIMRPDFGCGLRRYLMKPNTVATRALIQREVEQALRTWEPRIELQEVRVEEGDDPALVLVEIEYVHVRDRRPGNLIYPFYLER
jgi:phage baseplate assembly protein W